ncbi:MAG: ATPase, T2SS/T4P/T4SS family [Planctomycetota bacterium]|nr:ATPase, T2SS/T4P/T4SS family [Planctomycetota bacterium]
MQNPVIESLKSQKLLTDEQIEQALEAERETGWPLDKVLLSKGFVSEHDLLKAMASGLAIPYQENLTNTAVPDSFVNKVPVQFARNYYLVGVEQTNGTMRVATASPFDAYPMDDLASMLQMELEPVLAPRTEITSLINKAYKNKADIVEESVGDFADADMETLAESLGESEDILDVANKAPIIKLVNMLFFQALKMRASDIHLQPFEDRLQVRYRIDGILYDMESIPKKIQDAVTSRMKVMGKLDIAERRLPQDGRASLRLGDAEVDVRISSVPTNYGERLVMRLLDKTARLYELEEIGLIEGNLEMVDQFIHYNHGIIFVSGPTGSGKTTTLYSSLTRINSTKLNVMTIEDPIEYHLGGISQIQVNEKKGLTFASGLRSLLRQDPDIMMVGEVRDVETARIAIQAAQTGHLVFSTIHTNDAATVVTRLLDIGIEPYLVASSVIVCIAQRLVRRICKDCIEHHDPDADDLFRLKQLKIDPDELKDGKLVRGRGCGNCYGSGYAERLGIYEILPINDDVREHIVERHSASKIKRDAISQGFRTLRMDGSLKVKLGMTTPEEVLRVTQLDVM